MAKNQQNGIAQNLESEATQNSQPNKLFIPGSKSIPGADPEQPSINNATRREQYNVDQMIERTKDNYSLAEGERYLSHPNEPYPRGNSELPYKPSEDYNLYPPESTKIGDYSTTLGGDFYVSKTTTAYPEQTSEKRELKSYYSDLGGKEAMDEINAIFNQKGVNTAAKYFQETYGEAQATALNNAMQAQINLGKAIVEKRGFMGHTSMNADWVKNFAEEVYKAVAYNATHGIPNDINEIAKNTGGTPEEVQAVLTNDAYRLIELTDEYKNREFRQYYRSAEDASLQMEYNWQQYQNNKKYSDYQFESTMNKLERSLFDSERAAKTQGAIYGMTGTRYTLDRIKKQYEEQMNDVTQSYQYQSAQAQLNINYALETYGNTMARLSEEIDYATQDAQKLALQEMTNLNNAVGLSFTQQKQILLQLQSDIDKIKATGLQNVLTQWEAGNTTLSEQLAEAYGIDLSGAGTMRTERHNNPTAMTTDYAKMMGLVEGVDYIQGDSFTGEDGRTYYTARFLGDPIETAIKAFDTGAKNGVFKGQGGVLGHWHLGISNEQWLGLSDEEKRNVIYAILAKEGGNMDLMSYYTQRGTTASGGTEGEGSQLTTYNKDYEQDYITFLKDGTKGFPKAAQDKLTEKFGSWDNFVANANAYKAVIDKQVTEVADTMLRNMIEIRDWLSDSDGDDHGMMALRIGMPGTDAHKYKRMYKQIIASDALQNLINLKSKGATFGALSNQELGFITDAANWFSLWDNETNFTEELDNKINKILNKYGMTESDFLSSGRGTEMPNAGIYSPVPASSKSTFNTPGSMNNQGAYQSGTVNTGAAPVRQQ